MKRWPSLRHLAIGIALLMMLVASMADAQFQAGNIFGKVLGKDGGVLPGVTVTLTGIGAPQTNITGSQGEFRFINLSPGTYTVNAELAGYGSAVRTGIGVRVAQNADVTITLSPSVTQSITVTAEAPLLDVRKTGTGIDIPKVELQNIPSGRDPWVMMQQTPGVLLDRINVGGNESGQQSGYVSKGQTSDQSSWNVDGVNITDVGALGSTPTYYDFDSFEEMQITTGGSDPRIKTPGIQMNFVTKRGTNDWKGSGRWFQTNKAWQANPTIPAEAQSYLLFRNQIDKIEDRGFELGGPILKDRLWVWGALSRNNINNLTATVLNGSRFLDRTLLANENLKLNAQPISSNSLVVTDSYGNKIKLGRNVGVTRLPETSWNQQDSYKNGKKGSLGNPTIWKIEDTQIVGSSLYLTGLYSEVQGGFQLISDNGQGCNTFACGVAGPVSYQDQAGDGAWHRSYESYMSVRPQKQARLDGSKFFDTGKLNHELKFGFGYRNASVRSLSAWPSDQYTTVCSGCGNPGDTGAAFITRSPVDDFTYHVKYQDAYLGDTIVMGNLSVQAALRYDLQKGDNAGGSMGASPLLPDLLPAVTWGPVTGLKWNNVSPRVGLTYSLGSDRRTLLRASYNRYADQLGGGEVSLASPGAYSYLYYYFKDLNGDHVAQRNEIDFDYGLVGFGGIDPKNPSVSQQYYRWASSLKAPTTDEIILGAEHELLTDFSVGVNGTFRKMKNFVWYAGEHNRGAGDLYSSADYQLAPALSLCVKGTTGCAASATMKVVPFLPGGQTTLQLAPYYTLKSGVSAPAFFVIENRPDYSQTYKGVDLYATKRLSNRWMLRGNLTLQDWKQSVGSGGIIDPSVGRSGSQGYFGCTTCNSSQVVIGAGSGSGSKGGVYINSKWAYNVTGTYQIPIIETSFGLNITGRQGYVIPYVYRIAGSDGQGGSFKYVLAETKIDQYRQPNLTELDLRLAKDIRVYRGGGITLSVDAFNILNRQTILQRDVRRLQLAASNRIQELQSPRIFRVGARVTF